MTQEELKEAVQSVIGGVYPNPNMIDPLIHDRDMPPDSVAIEHPFYVNIGGRGPKRAFNEYNLRRRIKRRRGLQINVADEEALLMRLIDYKREKYGEESLIMD